MSGDRRGVALSPTTHWGNGVQLRPDVDHTAVFTAMPTPYLVLSPDLVIVDANPAYLATTGRALDDIVGRPVFEAFPGNPDDADPDGGPTEVRASLERARATGRADTMPVQEYAIPDGAGGLTQRFWSLISIPVLDGDGACRYLLQRAEDITQYVTEVARGVDERAEGEAWRRRSLEAQTDLYARGLELQAARDAEAVAARRLAALAGVALDVAGAESIDELIGLVIESGLSALGANGGALGVLGEDDLLELTMTAALGAGARQRFSRIPLDGPLPAAVVARTGRALLLPDRAASVALGAEMAEAVELTGCQAWATLPLTAGGRVVGSLLVGWTEPQEFRPADVELLVAFAVQCAQALDRLLTRAAERRTLIAVRGLAEALQRRLLTEPPQPDELHIAVRYLPAAREAQVGGDWYDSFRLGDGRTALVIGDVSGHDQEAAASMAQVRNLLRGIAHTRPDAPSQVLGALDRAMRDLGVDTYATAVLATIEDVPGIPGTRLLRWANAGHPAPLLVDPAGGVALLERSPELLLGLDPATRRTDHQVLLPPGATVLLYTDGLVEHRGTSLDDGSAWLVERVAGLVDLPLPDFCDELLAELSGGAADDVALLAIRARPAHQPG